MQDPNQRYARTYSESGLRRKLARYARAAGEEVVEKVLWLFYAALGEDGHLRRTGLLHLPPGRHSRSGAPGRLYR